MNEVSQIILIEGNYSEIEAKEILRNVIATKIHFHSMKNFSSKERFGKEDENSIKRISELQNSLLKINELLINAKANNQRLTIHSTINISTSE